MHEQVLSSANRRRRIRFFWNILEYGDGRKKTMISGKYRQIVIFLLAIFFLVAMTLPPPGPTPWEETQTQQQDTSPKEQGAQFHDHATQDAAPLVQLPQSPLITPPTDKESQERGDTSASNYPNWIVAFFTAMLALVAWLQYRAM